MQKVSKANLILSKENLSLIVISIALSIPSILFGQNLIFALPLFIVIILSFVYGERFLISVIMITLFALVGEFTKSYRIFIQLSSVGFLTYLFFNRYGLDISKYRQMPKTVFYNLILYLFAMIIASVMSEYPSAGAPIFVRQVIFLIVVYILFSLINNPLDIKNYINSFIIVSLILVTISLIYFIIEGYGISDLVSINRVRVSVLISNMEALTNFYVISFPFLVISLLIKKNKLNRFIYYFIILYIILGLILTMSRSAVIGILLSTAIIFYILRKRIFYKLILTLTIIVICFFVIDPLNEIFYQLFRFEEGVSVRDYLWLMTINIIKDHPVFGLGPGAYQYEVFNYFPFMLNEFFGKVFIYVSEVTDGGNLAHNIFLVFFSDMGIPGLITIIALPVVYFRIGIKTIKKYKDQAPEIYYLIVALFAAGTSVIVRNIFNSIGLLYVGGLVTDLPFWLIFSGLIYFYQTPLSKSSLETVSNSGSN